MSGFEVFTKKMAPLGKTPGVTIQKRGIITINRSAHALLGEPKAVELLYDRERERIGLRAVDETAQHAYQLRPQGLGDTGPMVVAGTAFTNYYKIDTSVSRRWVPKLEDGVMVLDLPEGLEVTSNRNRGTRDTAQDN